MTEIFIPIVIAIACIAFIMVPICFFEENGWLVFGWAAFSILLLGLIGGYAYDHRSPVETYQLPAGNWQCTSTYEARYFNGKMWTTRTECAEYSLRGER